MTVKREYSILPQGDKDDFHHHVREGRAPVTSQYFCLFTVITVTIVLILAGVATLTVSMFHSEPLSTTFTNFWYSYESTGLDGSNSSMATTASGDSSSSSFTVEAEGGSKDEAASAQQRNSTDYPGEKNKDKDLDYYRYHHHRHHNRHEQAAGGDQYNNSSDSSSESDQGFGYNSTFGGNGTLEESEMEGGDEEDQVIVNFVELKEKFADAMRDWEKNMEKMTGIRRAEFVVPLFMLICFLTMFTLISICCCVMMRRRDNRRRKLFGKLITDLQTGDSKTVLLNHSDLEE